MKFEEEIDNIAKQYPSRTSALLPILYVLQRKYGSITDDAIEEAAKLVGHSEAFVYGVYSFYTFYRRPGEGKYRIWVCSTLSCALCGAGKLFKQLKEVLKLNDSNTTPDGLFTLKKAECLGACEQAPVVQFEDEYLANATPERLATKIKEIQQTNLLQNTK